MTSSFAGLDALFSLVASPAGSDMESAPRHALLGLVLETLAAQPELPPAWWEKIAPLASQSSEDIPSPSSGLAPLPVSPAWSTLAQAHPPWAPGGWGESVVTAVLEGKLADPRILGMLLSLPGAPQATAEQASQWLVSFASSSCVWLVGSDYPAKVLAQLPGFANDQPPVWTVLPWSGGARPEAVASAWLAAGGDPWTVDLSTGQPQLLTWLPRFATTPAAWRALEKWLGDAMLKTPDHPQWDQIWACCLDIQQSLGIPAPSSAHFLGGTKAVHAAQPTAAPWAWHAIENALRQEFSLRGLETLAHLDIREIETSSTPWAGHPGHAWASAVASLRRPRVPSPDDGAAAVLADFRPGWAHFGRALSALELAASPPQHQQFPAWSVSPEASRLTGLVVQALDALVALPSKEEAVAGLRSLNPGPSHAPWPRLKELAAGLLARPLPAPLRLAWVQVTLMQGASHMATLQDALLCWAALPDEQAQALAVAFQRVCDSHLGQRAQESLQPPRGKIAAAKEKLALMAKLTDPPPRPRPRM